MKYSEFNFALETVFGSAYGQSLYTDLVLPRWGVSAKEAIAQGVAPQEVWDSLLEETESDPELRYLHRFEAKTLRQMKLPGQ